MSNLPQAPGGASNRSDSQLSNKQFELVIRRAAELQAKAAEEEIGGGGLSEGELIRIGRELGLSTTHLHQALAEVRGGTPAEKGLLAALYGEGRITATRTVRGPADEVRRRLEIYLLEQEYLAVLRRLRDRTLYTRATGIAAAAGRAASRMVRRSPLLNVSNLDVSVQPLEDGYSYIAMATSIEGQRVAAAAGAAVGGIGAGVATGAVLAVAIAPPAALLGLPWVVGCYYGTKKGFSSIAARAQLQLEALLDRVEHGELPPPVKRWSGIQL